MFSEIYGIVKNCATLINEFVLSFTVKSLTMSENFAHKLRFPSHYYLFLAFVENFANPEMRIKQKRKTEKGMKTAQSSPNIIWLRVEHMNLFAESILPS